MIPAISDSEPTPITKNSLESSGILSWAKLAVPVNVDMIITGMVNQAFFT